MQVLVTFRHMEPSDALRDHAVERIARIKKYFSNPGDAHVVLSVEKKTLQSAEITLNIHGLVMHAKETTADLYNAIDLAAQKIEIQAHRHHDRLIDHKPHEEVRVQESPASTLSA